MGDASDDMSDGDLVAPAPKLPVPDDVAEAIRTLLRWTGEDPSREGLLDTPQRVARAWKEYTQGYSEDPAQHLARVFEEVGGYDEIVLLRGAQWLLMHQYKPVGGLACDVPTDRSLCGH